MATAKTGKHFVDNKPQIMFNDKVFFFTSNAYFFRILTLPYPHKATAVWLRLEGKQWLWQIRYG